jgi:hypothetical protein
MPAMSDRPRRILTAYWLAPILVGLGYAAARTVAAGLAWPGLYAQSPFALAFFSGLLIAFAWRPVLLRVPWSRSVALALVAAVLLGTGPLGDWALARLVAAFHLAPFPYVLPRSVVPELAGLAAAAALLVLLFRITSTGRACAPGWPCAPGRRGWAGFPCSGRGPWRCGC